MIYGQTLLSLAFLVVFILMGRQAVAAGPKEQIQQTLERVVTIVNASASGNDERRVLLREALMPSFDFVEMAKRSLGKHWNNVPGRHEEFVALFTDFLGNSYLGQIAAYKDEKIVFVRERMDEGNAQVDTKVVPAKGEPITLTYRLHQVGGQWKIYDVVIEQISLVGNFRSQFNRVLTSGSFDDLIKLLKEKSARQGS